jgi:threonine synthase
MSIWKYREIKKTFEPTAKFITLDEGGTAFENPLDNLFLKREDLNPTGSWKDRGTAYKLTELANNGTTEGVISSSGNAAISFLEYSNKVFPEFKINIVVSPEVNKKKLEIIEALVNGTHHQLFLDIQAKKKSTQLAIEKKATLLRASTDSEIIKGYWSLGFELYSDYFKHNSNKENVLLVAVSSGTALVGILQGLFMKLEKEYKLPKVIVCQTQHCNPVVESFYQLNTLENINERSLADAIVDKSVLRMPQIIHSLKQTNGGALNITNEELENVKKTMEDLNYNLSYTSLLPIAGYIRLKTEMPNSNFICITSGR